MNRFKAAALALCASLFALPVLADDDYPLSLYEQFQEYRDLAVQNDPEAQYQLGLMYLKGQGVERDRIKGRDWLLKAAEADHSEAMNTLGRLYTNSETVFVPGGSAGSLQWAGVGPIRNRPSTEALFPRTVNDIPGLNLNAGKATYWFKRASDLGNAKALNNLGVLETFLEGTSPIPPKAIAYFEMAAERGNADGLYNLAIVLETEDEPDLTKIERTLHAAAQKGHLMAQRRIGGIKNRQEEYADAVKWCIIAQANETPVYRSITEQMPFHYCAIHGANEDDLNEGQRLTQEYIEQHPEVLNR